MTKSFLFKIVTVSIAAAFFFTISCGDDAGDGADTDTDTDTDIDTDTDTDTDQDTDIDSDSDTDSDTDTGPEIDYPCTWKWVDSGATEQLNGVWGEDTTNIIVVGNNGTILNFNGEQWISPDIVFSNDFYDIHGIQNENVNVVGDDIVLKFYDSSWEKICSDEIEYGSNTVWTLSTIDFICGLTFISYDGECSLSYAEGYNEGNTGLIQDIWGSDDGEIFLVGEGDQMGHYDGESWEWITIETKYLISDRITCSTIWGGSPENVYIGCYDGTLDECDDGYYAEILNYNGQNWELISDKSSFFECGERPIIWGTSLNTLFVSIFGGIYYWDGENWGPMEMEYGAGRINGFWGFSEEDVYAVGTGGVAHCTPD